jgi:hypothetical protein
MRRLVPLAIGALALFASSRARAQSEEECLKSPVDGQKLQRAGKLLDARERFRMCARSACPAEIVRDCTQWSRAVEDALPSVVMAARDRQGRDLIDVDVSIDGDASAAVGERAVSLDPGMHRFVFHRSGNPDIEQRVLLREGEKSRRIAATFGAETPMVVPPARARYTTIARPVPAAAWIVGGVGVLSLVSFGTFALVGIAERADHGCAGGCSEEQSDSVNVKFRVADVSLGAGLVALGIATWIYLSRPSVTQRATAKGVRSLRH